MNDDTALAGPLAGVVVADLSRVLAGPYAAMLLGDLGATVIKVEHPRGDETRHFRPPVRDDESTYYLSANRNKYAIALDFAKPDDLTTVRRIIARADIVIENFRPGSLEKFGLDYGTLSAEHPELVYASITGFGTGAGAHLPGYDLAAQALSGLMDLQGAVDGPPMRAGVAVIDVFTGLFAVNGVLAALYDRDRTGLGQRVSLDLLSVALAAMVNQTSAVIAGGVQPVRMGNEHPSLAPYAPYETADRPLVIAVGNDRQFARLCEVVGRPELATDARFVTNLARTEHRAELRVALESVLGTRRAEVWFRELSLVGVPAAPINDLSGGIAFAEDLGLDPVVHIGSSAQPAIRHPVTYSRTPADHRREPPALNADEAAIREWLAAPRER